MSTQASGNIAWKFGDNFNADNIVGSKYIGERDPELLAKVCLAEYDPEFTQKVMPGDLVVAGKNFGYGHPHQQGIISLLKNGVAALVAESFYPLWYRMAFFYAFPVIVCPEISASAEVGHALTVDLVKGEVQNKTTGKTLEAEPIPEFLMDVVESGGLIAHLKKQLAA